jgi:hypothetical protein
MAFFRGPQLVTEGLVLALDAANTKSYPGSGTVWGDLSGNGNNGTLVNGPTFDSGNNGSIVFDGVNDYVSLDSLIQEKPFTINFYSKINSVKNQSLYTSRTTIGTGISIFLLGGENEIRFDTGDTQFQWSTGYAVPLNTWINLVLLVDNSNKTLFVNGEFVSTIAFTSSIINISPTLATIGASQINGSSLGNFLDGILSNYFIYNRVLTSSEIQQNFNATKRRYGL